MAEASKGRRKPTITEIKVGQNVAGKLPPQALELEEAVLGALMIDKDAYSTVADLLRPESFYQDRHRFIYEAIRALALKEQPIDAFTVAEKLQSMGLLAEVGGAQVVTDLTNRVASSAHLRYHAQVIAQKATARDLIALAAKVEEGGYDETQDVEELLQMAQAGVFEISQRSQKREVTQIDPMIEKALKRMEAASQNEGNVSGLPSGFDALDKVTAGWQGSALVIIAARPAMGKTAFVLSMAKNMTVNYHIPVAMFSLEMSNVELVNRLIMNVCEIDGMKIKTGKFSYEEQKRLNTKINELYGAPFFIDDTPGLSVYELQSKARKLVREHGVKMIIIDYLQLMNAQGMNFGSREQEVSIISRSLKGLAKELDIPVIALSQLNRGVESRQGNDGKKPQLSDLRESGSIEQDADMVCFIHRPEYYKIWEDSDGTSTKGMAYICIAKHRSGATKDIRLRFRSEFAKFQNVDDEVVEYNDSGEVQASGSAVGSGYVTVRSSMNSSSADGATLRPSNSMGDETDRPF